jgi:hypothetical protein
VVSFWFFDLPWITPCSSFFPRISDLGKISVIRAISGKPLYSAFAIRADVLRASVSHRPAAVHLSTTFSGNLSYDRLCRLWASLGQA